MKNSICCDVANKSGVENILFAEPILHREALRASEKERDEQNDSQTDAAENVLKKVVAKPRLGESNLQKHDSRSAESDKGKCSDKSPVITAWRGVGRVKRLANVCFIQEAKLPRKSWVGPVVGLYESGSFGAPLLGGRGS